MDYGRLISRSWQITFRHRFLWWFGIIAALPGMAGNLSNFTNPRTFGEGWSGNSHHLSQSFQQLTFSSRTFLPPELSSRLETSGLLGLGLGILVLIIGLSLIIGLGIIAVTIMAQGGLKASVAGIERQEPVSFKRGFVIGYHAFWRLLAIGFLIFCAVLGVLALLALPVVLLAVSEHYVGAGLLGLLGLLIFIVPAFYLGNLSTYANMMVVVENRGVGESLAGSHQIIRRNLGSVILIWLLSGALAIAYTLAFMIVFFVMNMPLEILKTALAHAGLGAMASILVTVIFGLLASIVMLAFQTLMVVFISSYWTLAYLALIKPKEQIVEAPLPAPAA
jgi:hypothetical protein